MVDFHCQPILPRLLADKAFRTAWMREKLAFHIAASVRANRESRGWTQWQLARRASVSLSVIWRVETVETALRVDVRTLLKIARALDVALLVQFASWPEFIANIGDVRAVEPFELAMAA